MHYSLVYGEHKRKEEVCVYVPPVCFGTSINGRALEV